MERIQEKDLASSWFKRYYTTFIVYKYFNTYSVAQKRLTADNCKDGYFENYKKK